MKLVTQHFVSEWGCFEEGKRLETRHRLDGPIRPYPSNFMTFIPIHLTSNFRSTSMPVLAVVLPRWPYPAGPSTRIPRNFGRVYQVRRTAGKHPQTSAVPSLYSRYSLDRFRLWPKCTYSTPMAGQLYILSKAGAAESSIELVTACISQLDRMMSLNRLKLNSDKTQHHLGMGSLSTAPHIGQSLDYIILLDASTVRSVRGSRQSSWTSNLSMRDHVSRLCRTSYYQLVDSYGCIRVITHD